jgi:hypothetical protein
MRIEVERDIQQTAENVAQAIAIAKRQLNNLFERHQPWDTDSIVWQRMRESTSAIEHAMGVLSSLHGNPFLFD